MHLPPEQRELAMVIAEGLPEADRAQFRERLGAIDAQMAAGEAEVEKAVQVLEDLTREMEQMLKKTARVESESSEHQQDVAFAEEHLSGAV